MAAARFDTAVEEELLSRGATLCIAVGCVMLIRAGVEFEVLSSVEEIGVAEEVDVLTGEELEGNTGVVLTAGIPTLTPMLKSW